MCHAVILCIILSVAMDKAKVFTKKRRHTVGRIFEKNHENYLAKIDI